MNQHPRHPLRINVGFIISQPIGTNREIQFEFPELSFAPDLNFKPLAGVAKIGRTPQGVLVQGEFKAATEMECVRCLSVFNQPLCAEFHEIFAFDHRSTSESELIIPDDANIDLAPLVREFLTLDIPIKPLCREDCKGLCPECGENLNETICEHQRQKDEDMAIADWKETLARLKQQK